MSVKPQLSVELGRIPRTAKVIAALVPICVIAMTFILGFLRASRSPVPGSGGQGPSIAALMLIFIPLLVSVVLAIWVLLVGYVYADAGRRGMSRFLWMLVVIFVPNALGFILYFLLRHPVLAPCPRCGGALNDDVAYCPQCGAHVANSCPKCRRLVGLSDKFCSGCGSDLKQAAEHPG